MKVFRNGVFYNYDEEYSDKSWSKEQVFKASSLYATCRHLGYDEQLSYSLSYMYVVCESSMPGTKYEDKYMNIISKYLN